MKLTQLLSLTPAALLLAVAPLGATIVFVDDFVGTPEQSLSDYNSNYSVSTSNVDTWSQGIASNGQGAFFSQVSSGGGTGQITATNSADYINTAFADSRYLYASANFLIGDAADLTNVGGQLAVTITFQDHQDVRFGIRNDGGDLFAFAETGGRSIANIAPYTPGAEMIVAIRYDGVGTSWAIRPVYGLANPGLDEPPDWGSVLVDQSNSNTPHTTTAVTIGAGWSPSWGTPFKVEGTINNVKVGTTYADVAQIPEPRAYAAIFGLMVLGMILWRRRR